MVSHTAIEGAAIWDTLSFEQRQKVKDNFDIEYYRLQNPDVSGNELDLISHYLNEGYKQGRNPSQYFRTVPYIADHPELLKDGENPFLHFLLNDFIKNTGVSALSFPKQMKPGYVHVPPLNHADLVLPPAEPLTMEQALAQLSDTQLANIDQLRDAFDADYYVFRYKDVIAADLDPFEHYMTYGWRELRDPAGSFNTAYYLTHHADIANSKMNPFVHWVFHGRHEGRAACPFRMKIAGRSYNPKVIAIVPNYNHGRFLPRRIDSILAQTYSNIEIVILDDCSSDNSRDVIDSYIDRFPEKIRKIYNSVNSGGVFRQWKKGVDSTYSDLVWICESDDFCEPDFIEKLVPNFLDESVQIAFGRILETDIDGVSNTGLDDYRERSEPGIWGGNLIRPASHWFANGFGVNNLIANVGGCLWRRAPLSPAVWDEAGSYSVVGDWYLYIQIASGGQIAWVRDAVSYFRRHGTNTSSTSFTGPKFYRELERLMITLRETWDVPDETVRRFHANVANQYDYFNVSERFGPLDLHCNLSKLLQTRRKRQHILLASLGFVPGGGENFPIHLANSLVAHGWIVSFIIFDGDDVNEHMRKALNPCVSVYDALWVTEYGGERFLREAGVSLVHSHTIGSEMRFFDFWRVDPSTPYVVTLHGSYEVTELPEGLWRQITDPVDHFVYTADKNLLPLLGRPFDPDKFTKMANAMPVDPISFDMSREEMGIAEDAILFTLVARGIVNKGWNTAIQAFKAVRARHPGRAMHLCMVGEGDIPDALKAVHGDDPDISFLGYQVRISGLYRISDVAVVPTRFGGESYPLCIIQAVQTGTPVVASDVGEITGMLRIGDEAPGGLCVHASEDNDHFIADIARAMEEMLDDGLRNRLAEGAMTIGQSYSMEALIKNYSCIYNRIIDNRYETRLVQAA